MMFSGMQQALMAIGAISDTANSKLYDVHILLFNFSRPLMLKAFLMLLPFLFVIVFVSCFVCWQWRGALAFSVSSSIFPAWEPRADSM